MGRKRGESRMQERKKMEEDERRGRKQVERQRLKSLLRHSRVINFVPPRREERSSRLFLALYSLSLSLVNSSRLLFYPSPSAFCTTDSAQAAAFTSSDDPDDRTSFKRKKTEQADRIYLPEIQSRLISMPCSRTTLLLSSNNYSKGSSFSTQPTFFFFFFSFFSSFSCERTLIGNYFPH